jgi:hypothetical protein
VSSWWPPTESWPPAYGHRLTRPTGMRGIALHDRSRSGHVAYVHGGGSMQQASLQAFGGEMDIAACGCSWHGCSWHGCSWHCTGGICCLVRLRASASMFEPTCCRVSPRLLAHGPPRVHAHGRK